MKKLSVVAALLLLVSCDDPSGPRHPPGITFSVSEVSDTAGARILDALTIEVRGMNGALLPGVRVDFSGAAYPIFPAGQALSTWSALTNDSGRVTIGLVLPAMAGTHALYVRQGHYEDSVAVRVVPGAPVGITTLPRDTALRPGQSYAPVIHDVDRFGNIIVESNPSATLAISSTSATIAGGVVTAAAVGHARIVVESAGRRDTAYLSVLPEFVAGALPGPTLMDPFGTVLASADHATGGCLAWHPSGDRMLLSGLRVIHTSGAQSQINIGAVAAECGTYSSDGQWIYFEGRSLQDPVDVGRIWRLPAAGGSPVQVTVPTVGERHLSPTLSPDGRRLAFVRYSPSNLHVGFTLAVQDLETGRTDAIAFHPGMLGHARWSPTGEWIAYTHLDVSLLGGPRDPSGVRMRTVRPDGTDDRNPVITEASSGREAFMGPVNWSPDGQWLIGRGYPGGELKLVRLHDGQALLSTPATRAFYEVTWRPGH